ncbi:hypothetical protein UPYG_G00134950 [Umbra pygmaea]|uniref:NADPH oxidase organizer 1b n=1 Tax=Umbra pygmaea TaxID=75934 RepID=A0ABD0WTZ0_UMBPY
MEDQIRYVISVRIIGVMHGETRAKMFMTSILWSDDCEVIVYRSFLDFKNFHRLLKKRFPVEIVLRKRDRRIPKFRAIAMKRKIQEKGPSWLVRQMNLLEKYCNELLKCDTAVTHSSEVRHFFMPKNQDLQADVTKNSIMVTMEIDSTSGQRLSMGNVTQPFLTQSYCCVAPYETKDTKNRPFTVALDERLDVLIKDPAGWWLVEKDNKQLAWFPAPYLEILEEEADDNELDEIPLGGTLYCAMRSYSSEKQDEVSVPIGSLVEVLRKSDNGWWLIRYKGSAGYIPSMNLQPYHNPRAGIYSLQRELLSSSLSLATHINRSTLNLASSPSSRPGNYCPRLQMLPESNGDRASRIQKTRSLELLTQQDRVGQEFNLYPAVRGTSISGSDSSDSDFGSEGNGSLSHRERTSLSSSSGEETQDRPHSPQSLPHPEECDESLLTGFKPEAGSCKIATDAPKVPPRPRVNEILSRCTTMTRKAALASRGHLFSLQGPIQSS